MNDLSLDCESLGKRWDAPIIAIGAQVFDRKTGKMGATFYQAVTLASAVKNCRVDGNTLQWWLQQSVAARAVFDDPNRKDLASALYEFSSWARKIAAPMRVYARGPQQDCVWIEHACDVAAVGVSEPWAYKNVRDFRTIIDLAEFDESTIPQPAVKHNALANATYQARIIHACYKKVGAALRATDEEL